MPTSMPTHAPTTTPTSPPTRLPTAAPTPFPSTPVCTTASASQVAACVDVLGGSCYIHEAACEADLGTYSEDGCGTECGCCYSFPSPQPTTALCSSAPTMAEALCPGECYSSNASCIAVGGQFEADECGAGSCGCCVNMPSLLPTPMPSFPPTAQPSASPTAAPSAPPTATPSATPMVLPTGTPTTTPTAAPTLS